MSAKSYDAVVVGARCAGSPIAMLLARKGYRVLVVDKSTFPSDTVSTHMIHPPGIAALRRWGVLDAMLATGVPPVDTYAFDFGPFTLEGAPGTGETPLAYAPRRTRIDKVLVDAAAEAGAEVREGFTVDEILVEDGRVTGVRGHGRGGQPVTERARVVVGADGFRSVVAEAVAAERYHEKPKLLCGYYTYWSGLPMNGRFETYIRPGRGFAAWPTNDGVTLVVVGWPYAEFEANKSDVEGNYLKSLALAPEFAGRVDAATREERFAGMAVPNFFRKPYGPGWALVGDAGYNKDFITAMGMQDAFRDAELCARALDEALSGARPYDEAMAGYQATRDEGSLPMYEFTTELATLEPPPPDLVALLTAINGNQAAMDEFAQLNAGVVSPADFFAPPNVARLMSGQASRA
ncbi:NAD(P)/FAD-dependent oxidoreductase [Phytohabitans aurantiacus]|jgi:2-polyprenyl-6-methoxyphenol hydroxylase-like FAD-dependent oxidoreductase|uniref:FAD-dependent oxidoreductase n=1 Tax=Phytohabitans aurantiacus TaxID=3016789 RepID=A0ABQ5QXK3_9ACTN|nr:NAD(P)/FAD-dependent oxidoreductase [Phytohabitans aurantiacus]GLH98767.1 FAD-dependent oxidoreductase [Phytohabitans aurantiacus]